MTNPKADLLQGTLDMLILKALSLGPLHGYGIIQRIRRMSDEMLTVEQGALYPALYRIEQKKWVSSKWTNNETGRRAKFYKLTKAGEKRFASRKRLGPARIGGDEDARGDLSLDGTRTEERNVDTNSRRPCARTAAPRRCTQRYR